MDKEAQEAQEALKRLQEQGVGEKGLLSATVTVCVFRKWHVDETSPSRTRYLFLDGVSQDAHGTPFWIRAWWAIPLDDLAHFEELDKIPMNSIITLSADQCTLESVEDFHMESEEGMEQVDGDPEFCLGLKAPTRSPVVKVSDFGKEPIIAVESP